MAAAVGQSGSVTARDVFATATVTEPGPHFDAGLLVVAVPIPASTFGGVGAPNLAAVMALPEDVYRPPRQFSITVTTITLGSVVLIMSVVMCAYVRGARNRVRVLGSYTNRFEATAGSQGTPRGATVPAAQRKTPGAGHAAAARRRLGTDVPPTPRTPLGSQPQLLQTSLRRIGTVVQSRSDTVAATLFRTRARLGNTLLLVFAFAAVSGIYAVWNQGESSTIGFREVVPGLTEQVNLNAHLSHYSTFVLHQGTHQLLDGVPSQNRLMGA